MSEVNPVQAAVMEALAGTFPGIPGHDLPRFAHALTLDEPYAATVVEDAVPAGRLLAGRHTSTGYYPGVARNYTVYVPHRYDGTSEAALLVFQDGARYLGPEANAARVLDQLMDGGDMPLAIAVFVEPGEQGPGLPLYGGTDNRSIEYDGVDGRYISFLVEELLPQATAGLRIAPDAGSRAIVGLSSGGACAFNAAWQRPDVFGKVMSHCGSFVDIRGAHDLAGRVRREAPKPIRVYLQTGMHDLDITFGNWLLANRTMAAALSYRGYDHMLLVGEGGHSLRHGGAELANGLRWLWRP